MMNMRSRLYTPDSFKPNEVFRHNTLRNANSQTRTRRLVSEGSRKGRLSRQESITKYSKICNAFSFGYLPAVRVLKADVSELSVGSIFIGRSMKMMIDLPMKMEPTESSETSAFSTRTPGRYPKENALHIKHGESLKSRITLKYCYSI